jgi:outer membrane protein assembly factor BamB
MKTGEIAKVSPELTGLEKWIEGLIIKIRKNPFLGQEIAVKDNDGRIFFGEEKYFIQK